MDEAQKTALQTALKAQGTQHQTGGKDPAVPGPDHLVLLRELRAKWTGLFTDAIPTELQDPVIG